MDVKQVKGNNDPPACGGTLPTSLPVIWAIAHQIVWHYINLEEGSNNWEQKPQLAGIILQELQHAISRGEIELTTIRQVKNRHHANGVSVF